ncbi:MAG: succinate dehydrogenase/fumarate reductase iron-sulfur subunit [Desulfobacterales bacterium]|nr:succinate dehydrogenase/fumarate reductase iron-sulfur subunit [Desulfobacterales bacterium]
MSKEYDLTLKISRYDPDTRRSWVQDYHLNAGRILRFVDLFRKINDEQDPTLAWSSSCEHGQCGTCGMKINGKPLLTCELLVGRAFELFKAQTFWVEPLTVAPVIRDLVLDLEKAYDRVHFVKPYIIALAPPHPEGDEYRISPRVLETYVEATRCINCFCCATACVTQRNYLGPNAMLANIVRLMDPRETAKKERLNILYGEQGTPRCRTAQTCSFVCPKEIDIAHFIALAKEGAFAARPSSPR